MTRTELQRLAIGELWGRTERHPVAQPPVSRRTTLALPPLACRSSHKAAETMAIIDLAAMALHQDRLIFGGNR
jgi:hypothetical protein